MSWFARGRRGTARASVILLVGLAAALVAAPGYGAASGTLSFSLNPDSTVMAPGDTVTVTVKNIDARKSTTVLVATLTNLGAFQKVDGCTGVALGPGKTCRITVTNILTSVPSADVAGTLTVKGKKAGTTSARSVTFVVAGTACHVSNGTTSYVALQTAIDAAGSGDTLDIRGRCLGNFTIDHDLTLRGVAGGGTPTLDAQLVGVTLRISGAAAVALHDLVVTGGTGVGGAAIGGGIESAGTLTLTGSTAVTGNQTAVGFGISNEGSLTMNDSSSVSGNIATAGGGVGNEGTFTMNDSSSVAGNSALQEGAGVINSGTFVMNDSSSVSGNTSAGQGGGVANSGTLVMTGGSSVWGNSAGDIGGGILNFQPGTLAGAEAGVNVFDNTPQDIANAP